MSKDFQGILEDINNRFVYTSDKDQFGKKDKWHLMKSDRGELYGDCEDYSYTLLWMLEGKSLFKVFWSLLTKKSELWYCFSPSGVGHAVLKYEDKWIDNIQRRFVDDLEILGYKMVSRWCVFTIFFKALIKR